MLLEMLLTSTHTQMVLGPSWLLLWNGSSCDHASGSSSELLFVLDLGVAGETRGDEDTRLELLQVDQSPVCTSGS